MIVLEVVDEAGEVAGWVGEADRWVRSSWEARRLPHDSAARLALSRARANLELPAGYELRPVEIPADGQSTVLTEVPAVDVEVLGQITPGTVLVLRAPDMAISRERVARVKAELARRVGHDEFGVVFTGSDDATAEVLQAADLAEAGWVYVASPGVCPLCGSDQVTIHQGELLARACAHCGHRWSQFHPGESAA